MKSTLFLLLITNIFYYGVRNARKRSSLVYLTATPTKRIAEALQQKKLAASILPARYHRRPLPVPRRFWVQSWQRLSSKNIKIIAHHLKRLLVRNSVYYFAQAFINSPIACINS